MLSLKRALAIGILVLTLFLRPDEPLWAQCSVCRTSVENSEDPSGGNIARGINNGILYLMVIPYLFVAVTAVVVLRMRKRRQQKEASS
ncbi:MAG: hypothetical protein N2050_05460 [Flavobacteriales bacterium]|nr:hypothetical protein [Flavobacteriales bacterium]